ncbi:XdhC family protein [Marinobacter bohaiensis]|uniref:XdhC family protein n=1 Tax=Marinobacter bohaiensis TaxID=2201898 RepID=UPI000DAF3C7D|nr:XdhC family protein [Marinobacter bohaiensis]
MAHPQQDVLSTVVRWLEAGERVWLCTILETWGSSPRPAGSMLAVTASGAWAGSVSGGCLEEDLLHRTASLEAGDAPRVIDYGISNADQGRFRLPCGGRIRLLVEPLRRIEHLEPLAGLVAAMECNQAVRRSVTLDDGAVIVESGGDWATGIHEDDTGVHHVIGPECQLLLVGAGEVASHVAVFARRCGFAVTLCEPRETFLKGWQDDDTPVVTALPDDLIMQSYSDRFSGVLALAHDPRVDDLALLAALRADCFYVGAMGSRETSRARRERLISLGLDDVRLEQLHAPIGIAIRSKTPAEIAVSIIADLVDARHRLLADDSSL